MNANSLSANNTARSLYVHVPFCRHRCGYCNFSLLANRDHWIDAYLEAALFELDQLVEQLGHLPELETLYLGGGTPTHLDDQRFGAILEQLLMRVRLAEQCEFTVEANPLDITPSRVEQLNEFGINRISLGVQSFDDQKLKTLDRDHNKFLVRQSIDLLTPSIPRISIDLIFGAPNETMAVWQNDLTQAISSGCGHFSTYGLTFEKGTRFWNELQQGSKKEVDDDLYVEMYELAIEKLTSAGLEHYEVSSFARPNQRSQHNQVYWSGRSYFAIGPGACRFIDGQRSCNHAGPINYIKRMRDGVSPVVEVDELSPQDRARELLVVGLRRLEGVNPCEFETMTNFRINEIVGPLLNELISSGFLQFANDRLKLTHQGLLVSDSIWTRILNVADEEG